MVVSTRKSKAVRIAAVTLATCVAGAGALLAASSPATAAGGAEWNKFVALSKTDAATGAVLDGAVFRVEVTNPTQFWTSPDGRHFDAVDPSTWTLASAADHPPMTVDEFIAFEIDKHNQAIAQNQAIIDGFLADVLDPATVAAHEATLAAHQAALDAHAPYAEAIATANAERQRLADEIIALQDAGQPVPQELAEAHAAAQQAQADAITAGQPTADALAATQAATQAANTALDAHNAALAELNTRFPGGYLPWTIDDHGVSTTSFEASQPAWADAEAVKVAAGLAQAECNAKWGVSVEPTLVSGSGDSAVYSYDIATCDGVATLPIGSYAHSITEIEAPDGYVIDGTRYEVTQVSEAGFTFNGETYDTRGAVLPITNAAVPPTEPPVTPPATPPVTPPAPPVVPEKPVASEVLAMTGGDSNAVWSIGGIAAVLLAAGSALTIFRRRTAE